MQTCPGIFLKSLLESPGNLLEICSIKFVDTLLYSRWHWSMKQQCTLAGITWWEIGDLFRKRW